MYTLMNWNLNRLKEHLKQIDLSCTPIITEQMMRLDGCRREDLISLKGFQMPTDLKVLSLKFKQS